MMLGTVYIDDGTRVARHVIKIAEAVDADGFKESVEHGAQVFEVAGRDAGDPRRFIKIPKGAIIEYGPIGGEWPIGWGTRRA